MNINDIRTKPVPVRLDPLTRQRLQSAASKLGITTSSVIRFAIVQQLKQIESGIIQLMASTDQKAM